MAKSYESTRNFELKAAASEAVLKGIAEDGGLFVMRNLGERKVNIHSLVGKNYVEIAEVILEILQMCIRDRFFRVDFYCCSAFIGFQHFNFPFMF